VGQVVAVMSSIHTCNDTYNEYLVLLQASVAVMHSIDTHDHDVCVMCLLHSSCCCCLQPCCFLATSLALVLIVKLYQPFKTQQQGVRLIDLAVSRSTPYCVHVCHCAALCGSQSVYMYVQCPRGSIICQLCNVQCAPLLSLPLLTRSVTL
jgi:hypothetical protein